MRKKKARTDEVVIYRPFITLKNGRRLYAAAYGYRAWRLVIRKRRH